jgi:MFS family permease
MKDLLPAAGTAQYDNISASISSVFIFGWMAGGIAWGILCDISGRKKAFIYSTLCYGSFTLLTAFSPGWSFVILCRFLSGFGIGGVLVTTTLLIAESYPDKRKAILLGILSISIPLGIFSAGLINYFIAHWRYGFSVGIIPVLLSVPAAIYFTEPEGWREAKRSGVKNNLRQLFNPAFSKPLITGSLVFGTALIGLWATFSWLPSWIQSLIAGPGGQKERGLAMMMMGGGGLLGGFISGWIVNFIGVKRTLLLCFAASFILSIILFRATAAPGPALYFQIAFITVFFGMSQGALSVYIPDLFPVSLRATATGVCFNLGRFFTGIAVFFIGSLVDFLGGYGNAIFWFSFVFLIGFGITLFNRSPINVQTIK